MSTCDKQKCLILDFPIYYLHIYYLIEHSMTFPVEGKYLISNLKLNTLSNIQSAIPMDGGGGGGGGGGGESRVNQLSNDFFAIFGEQSQQKSHFGSQTLSNWLVFWGSLFVPLCLSSHLQMTLNYTNLILLLNLSQTIKACVSGVKVWVVQNKLKLNDYTETLLICSGCGIDLPSSLFLGRSCPTFQHSS